MGTNMSTTTAVRLTMTFNFPQRIRGTGWTESIDMGYTDVRTAINNKPFLDAFLVTRCNCLGIGPVLVEARLYGLVQPPTPNAPPPRRVSVSYPVPQQPNFGIAYNKSFGAAQPGEKNPYAADFAPTAYYVNLQTDLTGTPVYHRNYWLAGLPDVADETDSPNIVDPVTAPFVQLYLNALMNFAPAQGIQANACKNNVCIRSVDSSGANPIKQCTAWNINVNTYTVPAHGFLIGQPIIAEGMKTQVGGSCPRGRYLVASKPDDDTLTLQGAGVPTPPLKLGGFRAATKVFNTVSVATGEGFTNKKKGRPLQPSVGRRPRQLIKRA